MQRPRGRRAVVGGLLAVVLLLVAALSLTRWTAAPGTAAPNDTTTTSGGGTSGGGTSGGGTSGGGTSGSGAVTAPVRAARRAGAFRSEPPRSVRLPAGQVVPVRAVSTTRAGVLDVPHDIRTAGWWRGGSRLGDPLGSTLVAAHVDSTTQGLGPFAALLGVRPGQRFVVSSARLRQVFRTTSLRLLPQGPLVGHPWMFAASGQRRIVLVTCAPPFVPERGGYQRLAVVTAVPASAPTRTRAGVGP